MSLESRVFEQELTRLTSLLLDMDYAQFGNSLVCNGVITQATMAAILSTIVPLSKRDQVERLAKAMQDQVKQDADRFDHLILLMKFEPQLEQLAGRILNTYWERGGCRLWEWNTAVSTIQSAQPEPPRPVIRPQPSRLEPSQPPIVRPLVQPTIVRPLVQPPIVRPLVQPEFSSERTYFAHKNVPLETSILMNEVAASIPAKWRVVGAQLNVPSGILDAIQAQGAGLPQGSLHCFGYMLEEWRSRRTSPYTWENVLSVLKSNLVAEAALADRLAKMYGVSSNQTTPQLAVATVSSGPAASMSRIDDVPTIGELESITVDGDKVTIMADIAERWKEVCFAFNFDPVQRTAQKIEQKWGGDPAKCCLEMFQLWLKTKSASWGSLIRVLDHCEEVLLASQIKAYVGASE